MTDLIGGLYPKPRHENAPEFVIGKLSINVAQFREWMKAHLAANPGEEWINVDMKVSRAGKGYCQIDDWKPNQDAPKKAAQPARPDPVDFDDSRIPF